MKNPIVKFIILIIVLAVLWKFLKPPYIGISGAEIGVVEVKGTIRSSDTLVKWIKRLREDTDIKGILLRVDSPGGAVGPVQEILEALKKTRKAGKPIVASFGSVAASGGYYVSLASDKIVANPGTITGSIGVIAEFPVVSDLLKKLGIQYEIIKTGKFKDSGTPFRKMKPEEKKLLKGVLMDVYEQFVEEVASARHIPADSVRRLADGRIFSGRMALKAGLVDTLGSVEDAVNILKKLAGIKGHVNLVYKKEKKRFSLIDLLINRLEGELGSFKILYRMD